MRASGRSCPSAASPDLRLRGAAPQQLQLDLLVGRRRGPRERVGLRITRRSDPRAYLRGQLLELALLHRERLGEPRALLLELARAPARALGRAPDRQQLA